MADTLNQTLIYNNQVEILSTANRTSKVFQVGELVYDSQEEALYIGDLAQTPGGILLTNSSNLAVNKLDKSGDTMAGQLNMNSNAILNVPDPNDPKDAANKRYIDTAVNNLKFGLNLTINDLNDVDSALSPTDGDVLVYDGATQKFIVRPQNDVDNQSLTWDASSNSLSISQSNSVTIDNFTGTTDFQISNIGIANISQAYIDNLVVTSPFSTIRTDIQGDVYAVDSTLIIDADTPTINLDGTVRGNIIPDTDVAYDLGSATRRFRDIYLSGSTIDLGGTTLSVVGGALQIGGTDISEVVASAGINSLTAGSNIPTLETAYDDARAVLDALLDAGDYGAQLAPPSDYTYYEIAVQQKALNPLIPDEVVDEALNVLNAYNAWQNEIEAETATITVGDREWKFKGDGTVDGLNVDGDITGSVFANDSTVLVDGVNGKIVGPYDNGVVSINSTNVTTYDIFVQQDANTNDLYVANRIYGGETGATTTLVIGSTTTIESDVNFNDVVKFAKTTSTGGANSGTAIALDVTKTLQVLNSADGDDDFWTLADGTEGQIMHFVPGTGAGTNQHKVTIQNWRRWDSGAGVAGEWVVETNLDWLPFKLDFDGTRWTGVATAIFTDGAWQTNNPWID